MINTTLNAPKPIPYVRLSSICFQMVISLQHPSFSLHRRFLITTRQKNLYVFPGLTIRLHYIIFDYAIVYYTIFQLFGAYCKIVATLTLDIHQPKDLIVHGSWVLKALNKSGLKL